MAGFLRQIICRFDVTVDDKPLTELDKKIKRAKDSVNSAGRAMGVAWAAAGAGAYLLVDAASHAQETLQALKVTFKGNSDAVLGWAKTLGDELGRSEFTLRESALRFGAFLGPVFRDSGQDITAMSEKLSALAVDLAAFYDTSDEEAMMRLFSGMSGETEAVRRLGIDISDTSLDDLNKKNGDNRRLASLTLQEKTALRFQKIILDTEEKQGQAAREQNNWAGSLKRVRERFKTLSIVLGQQLMPYALKLLKWAEKQVPLLERLVARTSAFEAGLKLLAYASIGLAASWVALNLPLVALTAVATGLVLVFEDLIGFQKGYRSVLGDFISIVTGVNDPLKFFNGALDRVVGALDIFTANVMDLAVNLGRIVTGQALKDGFTTERGTAARERAGMRDKNAEGVMRGQEQQRLEAAGAGDVDAFRAAYAGSTMNAGQLNQAWLKYRQQAIDRDYGAGVSDGTGLVKGGRPEDALLNTRDTTFVKSPLAPVKNFGNQSFEQKYGAEGTAGQPFTQQPLAGAGSFSVVVNVTQTNATPEQIKQATKGAIQETLDEKNRKTAAAVGEEAVR